MRNASLWLGLVVVGFCCDEISLATAGAKSNPYEQIVERNPFGLKPPMPVVETPVSPVTPPPPLAAVEVSGFTSLFSRDRVLLEIIPGPGKPMIKPVLAAGDKVDSIEVISIDVLKSEVLVRNNGVMTNLTLRVAKTASATNPPVFAAMLSPQQGVGNVNERRGVLVGGGIPRRAPPLAPPLPGLPAVGRTAK